MVRDAGVSNTIVEMDNVKPSAGESSYLARL